MPTSPILDSSECIPMSVAESHVEEEFHGENNLHGQDIPKYKGEFDCDQDVEKNDLRKGRKMKWKNSRCCMYAKRVGVVIIAVNLVLLNVLAGFAYKCYTSHWTSGTSITRDGASTSKVIFGGEHTEKITQSPQYHVLSVNLDRQRRNHGGDFIWTCPPEGERNGFVCNSGSSFVVPVDGWYSLHMQVTIDTTLARRPLDKPLTVRDCIMKKDDALRAKEEIIRCNRMKIPAMSTWAGHSEITVLRHYLQKGQIIKAVTETSEELLHGNSDENVFEIALLRE